MTSILVADIGGTNVRFALVDKSGVHEPAFLKLADFEGPVDAAQAYLSHVHCLAPQSAVMAVAGPVLGGDTFSLTNHPWKFSIAATCKALKLKSLELINDFHAMALGVLHAEPEHVQAIGGGMVKKNANMGIIGPGTGLGMACLVWDPKSKRHVVVTCEGAHATMPFTSAREWAISQWLLERRYSHVSCERVCSGKGLLNLYDAIRAIDNRHDKPERTAEEVTKAGIDGSCDICREATNLMLGFLGRIAGNFALTNATFGGIYFTGGILPRLGIDHLISSRLRGEFVAKGRFTAYVDHIPTALVDDPYIALKGLRAYALNL